MNIISIINMGTTLFIALMALVIAVKTYNFKRGNAIKGNFSISRSVDCESPYISEIELENCKDKAVAIYGIYIKYRSNVYIEIKEFEDKPLILNPFETYKEIYDPINFYSINLDIADLDLVFKNKKKGKIVLSTSQGKYVVRKSIERWFPVGESLENFFMAVIRIFRFEYEGVCYGNAKYLLLITVDDSDETLKIPIGRKHYDRFRNFKITEKDIEDQETLQKLLQKQINNNIVNWKKVEVIDLEKIINLAKDRDYQQKILIETTGVFQYFIVGKLYTLWEEFKLFRLNKKRQKENEKRVNECIKNRDENLSNNKEK